MRLVPVFDGRAKPDSTDGELGFRSREVSIRSYQLVDALTGYTEEFGDLGDAHQIDRHRINIGKLLSNCKSDDTLAGRQEMARAVR